MQVAYKTSRLKSDRHTEHLNSKFQLYYVNPTCCVALENIQARHAKFSNAYFFNYAYYVKTK